MQILASRPHTMEKKSDDYPLRHLLSLFFVYTNTYIYQYNKNCEPIFGFIKVYAEKNPIWNRQLNSKGKRRLFGEK